MVAQVAGAHRAAPTILCWVLAAPSQVVEIYEDKKPKKAANIPHSLR